VFELIDTVARLRASLKVSDLVRGLVPTMGALHAGHAELIRRARRECGVVVVSLFVNPLQFDNQDDLARYPRTLDADLAMCRDLGVDIVFAPQAGEVYPQPPECSVDVGRLADHLCGKFRPGHFRGVATIVLKLFQMAQPHRAYFGEKDAQQLAIIKRMTADFNLPIEIVEVVTVREADGLAVSSRNRLLNPEERKAAPSLYRALAEAERRLSLGERDASLVREAAMNVLSGSSPTVPLKVEYLEIVDAGTLQPVNRVTRPVRIAGAVWVGSTRLIDNVLCVLS
jgi:pantoate--beta-alanine ligase